MTPTRSVTLTDYAKHRGVSLQAVINAINDGRLRQCIVVDPRGNRSILVDVADKEWAANTDPAMQQGSMQAKANAAARTPAEIRADGGTNPNEVNDPGPIDENDFHLETTDADGNVVKVDPFNLSRARKAEIDAKMKELEYRQAAGELVPAAEVEKAQFKLARIVRDQLLAVADRIAPQCAAELDPYRVHVLISTEIRKALETLTGEGSPAP